MTSTIATQGPRQVSAVDAQNPWPGLTAFTEELRDYFHGRSEEADDLFRRVKRKPLTVLFGQSGLGKTSLLQAGLFPRLRWEGFLPIPLRLDYAADALELSAQIKTTLADALKAAGATVVSFPSATETLWEYFHRFDIDLRKSDGGRICPVLVFDQFEDLFTRGQNGEESRFRTAPFLAELADLIENRAPATLEKRLEEEPDRVENFDFDKQPYRLLLSLREEFLPHLEDLRERMPSVAQNRLRLTRLNGRQALAAVIQPGHGLVSPVVARQIVRFVATGKRDAAVGNGRPEDDLDGLEVESSLLSLVCRELNGQRLARSLTHITADLLADRSEHILHDFYQRCLVDQPSGVRAFIEDELLTDSGLRENMALERARRHLVERGAPASALDELVKRRLLHVEERLQAQRVELTHDVLTAVVRKSREQRRQEEAVQQVEEREQLLRMKLRRSRRRLALVIVCLVATVGLLLYSLYQRGEAERQTHRAQESERKADARKQEAERQTRRARDSERKAQEEKRIADKQTAKIKRAKRILLTYVLDIAQEASQQDGDTAELLVAYARILQVSNAQLDQIQELDPDNSDALLIKTLNLASAARLAYRLKGKNEEVRSICGQGLDLAGKLAETTSDSGNLLILAIAHGMFAGTLKNVGACNEAHRAADKGLAIARQIGHNREEQAASSLSLLYQTRGDIYHAQAKETKARQAYKESLTWAEKAAHETESLRQLWMTSLQKGDLQLRLGHNRQACDSYQQAKGICLKLQRDKDSIEARQNLAASFEKLASAYKALGNLKEARIACDNDLRVRKALVSGDSFLLASEAQVKDIVRLAVRRWLIPDRRLRLDSGLPYNREDARYDLLLAYRRAGDLEMGLGVEAEVRTSSASSVGLLASPPADSLFLAVSTALVLGRIAQSRAEKDYRQSLAIAEALVRSKPSVKHQQQLSSTCEELAKVFAAQGDLARTETYYERSLKAIQAAASQELDNTSLLNAEALRYGKLASVQLARGKIKEAMENYRRSVALPGSWWFNANISSPSGKQ